MVLDAEKDRPFLKDLLPLADYIICNRNFPQAFTGRCVCSRWKYVCVLEGSELLKQSRVLLTAASEWCVRACCSVCVVPQWWWCVQEVQNETQNTSQ